MLLYLLFSVCLVLPNFWREVVGICNSFNNDALKWKNFRTAVERWYLAKSRAIFIVVPKKVRLLVIGLFCFLIYACPTFPSDNKLVFESTLSHLGSPVNEMCVFVSVTNSIKCLGHFCPFFKFVRLLRTIFVFGNTDFIGSYSFASRKLAS